MGVVIGKHYPKAIPVLDLTVMDGLVSRLLDQQAEDMRESFVEYCIELGKPYENDISWWVSNIGSRNTQASNLFLNCCRLFLIKKLIDEKCVIGRIIVDSRALKNCLKRYIDMNNLDIHLEYRPISRNGFSNKVKNTMKTSLSVKLMHSLFIILKQLLAASISKRIVRKNATAGKSIILLDNFVFDNSFNDHGFIDRYYPRLREYISAEEQSWVYYCPTGYQIKHYNKLYKRMRNARENFILKEDYLNLSDYYYAFVNAARIRLLIKKAPLFYGLDIMELIQEENNKDALSLTSIESLLKYRLALRMREKKVSLSLVVNWFENQAVDHGFNAGFQKWYPDVPLIGYQLIPHPNHYLCVFPTEQEKQCKVIPGEIAVMGKGFIEVAQKFCPSLKVSVAPALRFAYLWEARPAKADSKHDNFVILLALPLFIDEATGILKMAAAAMALLPGNFTILIKNHPANSIEQTRLAFGDGWPVTFQFVGEFFDVLLDRTHTVVTSSSSVSLETIAKGVPVIVIGNPFGITQRYIPEAINADIWTICYTAEELRTAIKCYVERKPHDIVRHQETGKEIRAAYFEPVNRESVRAFLHLTD